jgi:hypothetical protein
MKGMRILTASGSTSTVYNIYNNTVPATLHRILKNFDVRSSYKYEYYQKWLSYICCQLRNTFIISKNKYRAL